MAAALFLSAVLALAALLSGCGDSSGTAAEPSSTDQAAAVKTLGDGRTGAVLEPVDGGDASGTALLLKRTSSKPARFKVHVEGLEPNVYGGQYVVWLTSSRHDMVPLYSYAVGDSGVFSHEWTPNPLHVSFIERGKKTKFLLTLAKNSAEHEEVLEGGARRYDPPFIGKPVVEGTITGPEAGATG